MEPATPFAQVPTTPEPIIAQVRRQLDDDARGGAPVPPGVLDRVADDAVRQLWPSRVKTFVPVLALRTARERLHKPAVASSPPEVTFTAVSVAESGPGDRVEETSGPS